MHWNHQPYYTKLTCLESQGCYPDAYGRHPGWLRSRCPYIYPLVQGFRSFTGLAKGRFSHRHDLLLAGPPEEAGGGMIVEGEDRRHWDVLGVRQANERTNIDDDLNEEHHIEKHRKLHFGSDLWRHQRIEYQHIATTMHGKEGMHTTSIITRYKMKSHEHTLPALVTCHCTLQIGVLSYQIGMRSIRQAEQH
eukprot:scaffold112208_cov25-Prasinocladus_malaysianus.AAC.2